MTPAPALAPKFKFSEGVRENITRRYHHISYKLARVEVKYVRTLLYTPGAAAGRGRTHRAASALARRRTKKNSIDSDTYLTRVI